MPDVTHIDEARPHNSGPAVCLHCSHEWTGVAPVGVPTMECPECGTFHGIWKGPVMPDTFWRCGCGCEVFHLTPDGAKCRMCGEVAVGWL